MSLIFFSFSCFVFSLLFVRSSYFQQIEEDVQKYTKQIIELRPKISNFKTSDMTELIKFHRDVESILENLTDESQVSLENSCLFDLQSHSLQLVLSFIYHGKKLCCCTGAITV